MTTARRKGGRAVTIRRREEPPPPVLAPLTNAELEASLRAYERCKPQLEAALSRIGRPIPCAGGLDDPGTPRPVRSGPNVYYRCVEHGLALDPWGRCHHGCRRCAREAPFERIWTHRGSCQPTRQQLIRG